MPRDIYRERQILGHTYHPDGSMTLIVLGVECVPIAEPSRKRIPTARVVRRRRKRR